MMCDLLIVVVRMKRTKGSPRQPLLFPDLQRLKDQEEKLRAERIALLKAELEKAREAVRTLERELRLAGATREELGSGRIDWDKAYQELGSTFTAKDVRDLTGASPNLVATMVFKWKKERRIMGVGRGEYRKLRRA